MYRKPSNNRFGGRPSFNRGRRPAGGSRRFSGQRIDVSKFINKAVITEVTEHFKPEHMFADFQIDERLKKNIVTKGYVAPSPIQDRAIPHVLQGRDVVGIANTGTGKTAAFLIPALNKLINNPKEKTLIIVPTRELAIQIDEEFKGFSKGLGVYSVCCVGGAYIGRQLSELRRKTDIIIGTPGRLKDLIDRKAFYLADFKTVVLDEADRMLDMGFINDMKMIMSKMPKDRQTLFFSATMSPEIQNIIKDFLRDPVSISVKTGDTARDVDQDIVRIVKGKTKMDTLQELLKKDGFTKVLIFGRTKHGVERLSQDLVKKGFKADSIHGDKPHSRRQRALGGFKDNQVQVLVATDVAARGIDVSDVTHVINFDIPATYEDYVHRIGRTGRGGKKGKALTFIE